MKYSFASKLTAFLMALLALSACEEKDTSHLSIQGTLDNAVGETVYIQALTKDAKPDSTTVGPDGSFVLSMDNPPMNFYRFYTKEMKEPLLMAFDSTQRNITVTADVNDAIASYRVTGSKDSELLQQMITRKTKFRAEMDSVKALQAQLPADADPILRKAVAQQDDKLKQNFDAEMKKWAMDNSNSLAALAIISEVDLLQAVPEYKSLRQKMGSIIPGSDLLKTMDQNIVNLDKALAQQKAPANLKTGNPAPEITQPQPNGQMFSLSELRGKYVLIDFWASWCGPCRRENPNVKRLYDKYGGDQFEILSVSLDNNKGRWEQAIEADGMNWKHVSDLKKWSSAAAADYGVSSIPFTVLVDPDGNIVATKLRGPGLQQKLEELFGA